jgi:hypothetical protein
MWMVSVTIPVQAALQGTIGGLRLNHHHYNAQELSAYFLVFYGLSSFYRANVKKCRDFAQFSICGCYHRKS